MWSARRTDGWGKRQAEAEALERISALEREERKRRCVLVTEVVRRGAREQLAALPENEMVRESAEAIEAFLAQKEHARALRAEADERRRRRREAEQRRFERAQLEAESMVCSSPSPPLFSFSFPLPLYPSPSLFLSLSLSFSLLLSPLSLSLSLCVLPTRKRGARGTRDPRRGAGAALSRGAGAARGGAGAAAGREAGGGRPPPPRTNRTRRVPHPVLIGHAASLTPYRSRGAR